MGFLEDRKSTAKSNYRNDELKYAARNWHDISRKFNYQYMFEMYGLPIIQDPQDIVMLQELIWKSKPSIIIETGVARGGSLVLSASVLAVLDRCDENEVSKQNRRKVIGIDIKITKESREAIESHPLNFMIDLIEGSSVDTATLESLKQRIPNNSSVMVILDSNHTHEHVREELAAYSNLVTEGMPLIVMDTGIEFADESTLNLERPWKKGNNPYTAVKEFLNSDLGHLFKVNQEIEERHIITCAPEGVLFRIARSK